MLFPGRHNIGIGGRRRDKQVLGREVDVEIHPCDETEPATGMVLTGGGNDILGTEEEF